MENTFKEKLRDLSLNIQNMEIFFPFFTRLMNDLRHIGVEINVTKNFKLEK